MDPEKNNFLQNGPNQIRSVAKALMILDLLTENPHGLSLSAISRKLNMAKSTTHGILSTMRDFGYIEQSPFNGYYKLGMRLFEAGNVIANNMDVRRIAIPYIQKLVDEVHETVHLAVLDKGEVLYIDKQECIRSFRIISQVGSRLPAHCTGVGKALLAYLPAEEVKRIIATKGLQRYTKHTITDPVKLEAELESIRKQGYALDNQEIMESLQCVAAPIRNYDGKVCAAISVSGVSSRIKGEMLQTIIGLVLDTAGAISSELGYHCDRRSNSCGT